jgi:hypothetical protein
MQFSDHAPNTARNDAFVWTSAARLRRARRSFVRWTLAAGTKMPNVRSAAAYTASKTLERTGTCGCFAPNNCLFIPYPFEAERRSGVSRDQHAFSTAAATLRSIIEREGVHEPQHLVRGSDPEPISGFPLEASCTRCGFLYSRVSAGGGDTMSPTHLTRMSPMAGCDRSRWGQDGPQIEKPHIRPADQHRRA